MPKEMTALSTPNASGKSPDPNGEQTPNRPSKFKGRFFPGLIFAIGYILSPLSWWNDAFVNLPLAYLLATLFNNFLVSNAFNIAMIVAYWLSNLAGILFMLWGGPRLLGKTPPPRREIWLSLGVSLLYTLGICLLMQWGIVRPFKF